MRAPVAGVPLGSPFRGGASTRTDAERCGREAERPVTDALFVVELDVRVVEEQEVLALDVEDQTFGVRCGRPEHAGVEQRVEQEGGIAGLRGDAEIPADVDVGTLGAVDEVEVARTRFVVSRQTRRQPPLDVGEVESGVTFGIDRPADARRPAVAARTFRGRSE